MGESTACKNMCEMRANDYQVHRICKLIDGNSSYGNLQLVNVSLMSKRTEEPSFALLAFSQQSAKFFWIEYNINKLNTEQHLLANLHDELF